MVEQPNNFVITVGDNFYDLGRYSQEEHWADSYRGVYDLSKLHTWYPSLGNHDHDGGRIEDQIGVLHDGHWQMEDRRYVKSLTTAHGQTVRLIITDTSRLADPQDYPAPADFVEDEWTWIENALKVPADWKLVFGHHPVYSSGSFLRKRDYPEFRVQLETLLRTYGAQAYICGHDHHLEHIKVCEVHYVISGGGSKTEGIGSRKVDGHEWGRGKAGFAACRLFPDRLEITFIGKKREPLGNAIIPRLPNRNCIAA